MAQAAALVAQHKTQRRRRRRQQGGRVARFVRANHRPAGVFNALQGARHVGDARNGHKRQRPGGGAGGGGKRGGAALGGDNGGGIKGAGNARQSAKIARVGYAVNCQQRARRGLQRQLQAALRQQGARRHALVFVAARQLRQLAGAQRLHRHARRRRLLLQLQNAGVAACGVNKKAAGAARLQNGGNGANADCRCFLRLLPWRVWRAGGRRAAFWHGCIIMAGMGKEQKTTAMQAAEIEQLAQDCLRHNGANEQNAAALARVIAAAEAAGSHSHGLFRLPSYIASLRSGKINGNARPQLTHKTAAGLQVDGDNGFAAVAHEVAIPALTRAAQSAGVAAAAVTRAFHMSALWHEAEAIANAGCFGLACVSYMPAVAPAGGQKAFFGTNPLALAWPRHKRPPVVLDMATAAMAKGEVQVAARDGKPIAAGAGLNKNGEPATSAAEILDGGVLLPFGGHKGSGLALFVELLAGGLLGESFSYEAKAKDNGDGGPPRGGELLLAICPQSFAGDGWAAHCEAFFAAFAAANPGARLPGERRHANRAKCAQGEPVAVKDSLLAPVLALMRKA